MVVSSNGCVRSTRRAVSASTAMPTRATSTIATHKGRLHRHPRSLYAMGDQCVRATRAVKIEARRTRNDLFPVRSRDRDQDVPPAPGARARLLPIWKLWVSALALVAAVTATALRLHRPVCPGCRAGVPGGFVGTADGSTRRAILRAGGAAVAASVGGVAAAVGRNAGWIAVGREIFNPQVETSASNPRPEWGDSRIKGYRRLGRTNAMVSDISLGSGRIHDQAVPEAAIERGVTYIDTAPDYADAGSETILGEVMKGRRDKIFLATKFCRPDGHLPNDTPVPKILEALKHTLPLLNT